MHPRAHKSEAGKATLSSSISGETYNGVPTNVPLASFGDSIFSGSNDC